MTKCYKLRQSFIEQRTRLIQKILDNSGAIIKNNLCCKDLTFFKQTSPSNSEFTLRTCVFPLTWKPKVSLTYKHGSFMHH